MKVVIALFQRSLRLADNKVWNNAIQLAYANNALVLPLFNFDPNQIQNNIFRSDNAIQFMLQCLKEMDNELQVMGSMLYTSQMPFDQLLPMLTQQVQVFAISYSKDHTPYAKKREEILLNQCRNYNVLAFACEDYTLFPIEKYNNKAGTTYHVFGPYYRHVIQMLQESSSWYPQYIEVNPNYLVYANNVKSIHGYYDMTNIKYQFNEHAAEIGGRKRGADKLHNIAYFVNYADTRDTLSLPTTQLSAHIKFGTVSMRECAAAISQKLSYDHELLRQLLWHDYFAAILDDSEIFNTLGDGNFTGLTFKGYDIQNWNTNRQMFDAWCQGKTGFPIVDAAMRQLNVSGYMHNRTRMIVANFLTTICRINWRWGEWYFATKLIDYDPASNNGNWQDNNNIGVTNHRYFQTFNLIDQVRKFDPDLTYIRRWLPEIAHLTNQEILYPSVGQYYTPIIDYAVAKDSAKTWLTSHNKI